MIKTFEEIIILLLLLFSSESSIYILIVCWPFYPKLFKNVFFFVIILL